MLLSHKYKFIFIKTKKTSGTAFETVVSKYLGENDIITPVSELNLFGKIRRFENITEEDSRFKFNNVVPRNYRGNLYEETINFLKQFYSFQKRYLVNIIRKSFGFSSLKYIKYKRRFKFEQHMTCKELRSILPRDVYNNYTKITIIRNPYDQAISDYYDMKNRAEHEEVKDFDHYLEIRCEEFFKKNYEKFVIDESIEANHVFKYENINNDLKKFCKDKNFPTQVLDDYNKFSVHSGINPKKINLNPSQKIKIRKYASFFFENFYQDLT